MLCLVSCVIVDSFQFLRRHWFTVFYVKDWIGLNGLDCYFYCYTACAFSRLLVRRLTSVLCHTWGSQAPGHVTRGPASRAAKPRGAGRPLSVHRPTLTVAIMMHCVQCIIMASWCPSCSSRFCCMTCWPTSRCARVLKTKSCNIEPGVGVVGFPVALPAVEMGPSARALRSANCASTNHNRTQYVTLTQYYRLQHASIWDQCKKYEYWRPTIDQRPTSGPIHTFWENSNGHNSPKRHPIQVVFGSRVGFSGTADRTAPLVGIGSNPRWRSAAILKKNQTDRSLKRIIRFT